MEKCRRSPHYFINTYCRIEDSITRSWIPFHMWPAQAEALQDILDNQFAIALKARQLGITAIVLAQILSSMLFHPIAKVVALSKGVRESKELIERLSGMHDRLPDWMRQNVRGQNSEEIEFANGSRVLSFPTTGGRSFTGTMAVIDEADVLPPSSSEEGRLGQMIDAVKPTVDAGGKLVLISTVDKARPMSLFKKIYKAAKEGQANYKPIFLPWHARPDRTPEWYADECRTCLATRGSLDYIHQEYPATDTEALAPRVLDKRLAPQWLEQCYQPMGPMTDAELRAWYNPTVAGALPSPPPAIPQLVIYKPPTIGGQYVMGADPAQGNPTSDDSAAHVLDRRTGEEVACLCGKIEMSVFAAHIDRIGIFYNHAPAMIELNNHGHAVIAWLRDNGHIQVLHGLDDKPGWATTTKSKTMLYDETADAFRNKETILHSFATWAQLSSIEGATLKAPEGMFDDRAVSYVLAIAGINRTLFDWVVKAPRERSKREETTPTDAFIGGDKSMDKQMQEMGW